MYSWLPVQLTRRQRNISEVCLVHFIIYCLKTRTNEIDAAKFCLECNNFSQISFEKYKKKEEKEEDEEKEKEEEKEEEGI